MGDDRGGGREEGVGGGVRVARGEVVAVYLELGEWRDDEVFGGMGGGKRGGLG